MAATVTPIVRAWGPGSRMVATIASPSATSTPTCTDTFSPTLAISNPDATSAPVAEPSRFAA